ncbi:MAG: class I SAM-dependent methyltransferase [Steroidobacteraceae bacterium]
MSDDFFSASWLDLREAADARARSPLLLARLARAVESAETVNVVDLGCGTGANLRALAPRCGATQRWWLLDHDARLLDELPARMRDWCTRCGWSLRAVPHDALRMQLRGSGHDIEVETRVVDIGHGLVALPAGRPLLITASALLDLASRNWIVQLVAQCAAVRAMFYFALSYDGRLSFDPPLADDAWLREQVNLHQCGNKGFGPALGPAAAAFTRQMLDDAGYHCETLPSNWHLDASQSALQRQLLAGWAQAAREIATDSAARVGRWLAARLQAVERGDSQLVVGHLDLFAMPAGMHAFT